MIASSFAKPSYSTSFSKQGLFLGFPCGFGSPVGSQRGFGGTGIGFLARRSAPHFDSLTTSLEAISAW